MESVVTVRLADPDCSMSPLHNWYKGNSPPGGAGTTGGNNNGNSSLGGGNDGEHKPLFASGL